MSAPAPRTGLAAAAPAIAENTEQDGSAAPQVPRFFFDTLPLHPRPRPCESLTSYVARLARANGIGSVGTLWAAFFPTIPKKYVQRLADHEPSDLGTVAALAACPEAVVRATTFAHIGEKFGRMGGPYEAQRFLGPSLAPSPRYCPECLADDCYYRLPWRFTALPGCPEHGRVLLERCGHCGHALPFLAGPFAPGACAACRGDLRLCAADELDAPGRAAAVRVWRELLFLLAPSPAPPGARRGAELVAEHLLAARRGAGLTRVASATRFGIVWPQLRAMERPAPRDTARGPALRTYLRYADGLGIALSGCFTPSPSPAESAGRPAPAPPRVAERRQERYQGPAEHEERLVERALAWMATCDARGEPITIGGVAAELGLSRRGLDYYPQMRRVLDDIRARQADAGYRARALARREASLLALVEERRVVLAACGKELDPKGIGKLLGVSPATIRRFAVVHASIERIIDGDGAA